MKKKASITEFLEHRLLSDEIVDMMDKTEVCLRCGLPLKYQDKKEKRRNRGYCSLECYYALPPKFAYVEKKMGVDITDFILQELSRCDNVTTVAQLMGVQRQTLSRFMKKRHIERKVEWRVHNG